MLRFGSTRSDSRRRLSSRRRPGSATSSRHRPRSANKPLRLWPTHFYGLGLSTSPAVLLASFSAAQRTPGRAEGARAPHKPHQVDCHTPVDRVRPARCAPRPWRCWHRGAQVKRPSGPTPVSRQHDSCSRGWMSSRRVRLRRTSSAPGAGRRPRAKAGLGTGLCRCRSATRCVVEPHDATANQARAVLELQPEFAWPALCANHTRVVALALRGLARSLAIDSEA